MRCQVTAILATLSAFGLAACSDSAMPASPSADPATIVNGTPTGSAFPAVGALLYDFNANGIVEADDELCSGSLVAPTVFLTAAHCVAWLPPGSQLYVSFEPTLAPAPASFIVATGFEYDARYGWDQANPNDLAVVHLPTGSTAGITPLKLPPADYLDGLAGKGGLKGVSFIGVGYGASATRTGPPSFPYDGVRRQAQSLFMALTPNWLALRFISGATGWGGDCYGDSGGPKFLASDPTTVVANVVTGDAICRATSWDYRLDTPSARSFLGQFVTLP